MFGLTPFAKVSFAAIGVAFVVATTEDVSAADSQVFNAQYAVSIAEASTINNADSEQDAFFEGITENITLADVEAASIQFQFIVTEAVTSAESESITAQFNATIIEAWGQTPYSVLQNPLTFAGFAMAGSPFAGNFNTNGYLENPSYVVQANLLDSITENTAIAETETITAQYPLSITETTNIAETETIVAQFLESITEAVTSADSSTQISTFLESLTEATTITEIDTLVAGFVESIVEPATLNNSQSITAQFVEIIAEAITVADSSTQQSNFLNSIVETFTILDSQFPRGWIRIDDSETANWGFRNQNINEIGGFATSTFAGTPFAGYLNFSGNVPAPIVPDTNSAWTLINDTENANWNFRNQTIIEIGGFATCTFGGVPFAGYLSFTGTVPNPIIDVNTPNWTPIDNSEANNWQVINDTQG